ncbi:MAG: F0F1 ATP synthase subunit alpha, partial [Nitrospirae bacterium]
MTNRSLKELKERLKGFPFGVHIEEVGFVEDAGDGVARISGLSSARYNELVYFENRNYGIVFSLKPDMVEVVIVGEP